MTVLLLVAGALAAVVLSGFVSAVETGSYVLSRVRLRVRVQQDAAGARRLARILGHQGDVVLAALLGNTVSDYFCTVCVAALLLELSVSGSAAELWTTAIVTPALLVFGGIIPKDWFRREADRRMYALALPVELMVRVGRLTGFLWLMRRVTQALVRRLDPDRPDQANLLPRVRVQQLLHEGAAAGGLSNWQRDVIERVLNLSAVRVADVMIPRARAATVARNISRADFLRIVRMAHFSRYPVHDGDPRRIVGIVYVFDVLTDPQERSVAEHMRPPLTLGEQVRVSAALLRMQQARQTMGIVVDRTGGCVGILTVKDLVEEIVGDLEAW